MSAATSESPKTYRVVQWATGNIGLRSLRAVIEHPHLQLVGLYVYSADKAGRDAGELCGVGPVGVKATRSLEDVIALKPDCVLYMAIDTNLDEICALLSAGVNVVTTRGDFHYPKAMAPAVRARVEEACRSGGGSIHSTGSSPGFITEALPLVLTSLARRLDMLTIDEFADVSSRDSPEMIFQIMGFGQAPAQFDERRVAYFHHAFQSSLHLVADALSMPLDDVVAEGEAAVARQTTKIAAGMVEKGTIGATRITLTGMRRGRPLVRFRANWYCVKDVEPAWELRETGWRVQVEGDTPLDVGIRFPVPPERWAETSPGLTAHRAVNAVPMVCDAPPGIRTTLDLPQIVADLG